MTSLSRCTKGQTAEVGNVIRKEKEKTGGGGEKRKELFKQPLNPKSNFNSKKLRNFGGFQGNPRRNNGGQWTYHLNIKLVKDSFFKNCSLNFIKKLTYHLNIKLVKFLLVYLVSFYLS